MFTHTIVHGIMLGGLYAIVALGLSLVFGVMRLVNLAHGTMIVGGGYLAHFVVAGSGIDPLLALLVVCPVMFAIGYGMQRWLITDLLARGSEPALVGTFGLLLLGQGAFTLIFTSGPVSLPASYANVGIDLAATRVRLIDLIALALGVALVLGISMLMRRSLFGIALRAAAADPSTASTMGIDVRNVYAVTFGLAAALAAIAGVIVGIGLSFTPTSGLAYLTIGFTVVVLGGLGSVSGTLIAAMLVGLAQAIGGALFGPVYQLLTVYLLFILLLALRPQGLFGRPAS